LGERQTLDRFMTVFNKTRPFLASIKERYPLSKPESSKKTCHLVLDIRGSGLSYEVGDSVGIFASYDESLVNQTLQALRGDGQELVQWKQHEGALSFVECLRTKVNLTTVSSQLFHEVVARQSNLMKKRVLQKLQQEDQRDQLKTYLANYEVWDFLLEHSEVSLTPQELVNLLMPLLPRFYSISSSQRYVGEEVHLTVAALEYESNGHKRQGVCTHYLCNQAELGIPTVPLFIQPSHGFHLPADPHASLVMVGPGTGIAPFRAFLQERLLCHQSKGKHWLFFGERHRACDFFYEKEWTTLSQKGNFYLDVAFSRDQPHKIYVQHKMWEKGRELYEWLEQGAYLYVCGDAQRMAKDVEIALQAIIQTFGQKEESAAKDYIKQLRKQKRYLRDVY
jgi:sulfite reductase (NADPH) flavoprotein alpha-component